MLIPNNPDIDFDDLNARISRRMRETPEIPQPVPLHVLLHMEELDFIEQAYANYLSRLPDSSEVMQMQSALHQGQDKQDIIVQLLKTDAYRRQGVPLKSRRLKLRLLLERIPILNRLSRLLRTLAHLPRLPRYLRAQQNLLHRQQQEYRAAIADLQEQVRQHEHHAAIIADLQAQVSTLQTAQDTQKTAMEAARLATEHTDRRLKALQLALSTLDRPTPASRNTPSAPAQSADIDPCFYLALEERFRGTPDNIRERLTDYLPLLRGNTLLQQPGHCIVDLGCGRGEWLRLLRDEGYNTLGIDLSPINTAMCQEASLEVITGDAINWLSQQPDASISCITGFHIIEHLEFSLLRTLFEQSMRVLQPGGILILETPNPENLVTGITHFHTDPTHLNPLPPALIEFMADYYGYADIEILRLHPIPDEYQIHEDSETARRCNQYFYSAQDYALVATRPETHEDKN